MKVLFTNNYAMDWAWDMWKKKEYPGHHLWGITHLPEYGINVEILPYERYTTLKTISSKIKVLGDLDQQLRIILKQSDYDLVYSGHDISTSLLAFLRLLGIYKKPIAITMHRSFKQNLFWRIYVELFIKPHDLFLCLSPIIMERLRDRFNIPEEKLHVLPLGVDLEFYKPNLKTADKQTEESNGFIISTGKTGRDYNTLVEAFKTIDYPLKIYGAGDSAPTIPDLTPNIFVHNKHANDPNFLSFEELLIEHEKAYAVAIPLYIPPERADTVTLLGNTSLRDAMAMGKAVVMTRNRQIDIDIEKEKIGIWVEPGDVEGWQKAITYLLDHPEETKEMGNRGRYLCESKYNLDVFSSSLAKSLKRVFGKLGLEKTELLNRT
jgi:glycosyltransferase involved in cell wall biosynthesis